MNSLIESCKSAMDNNNKVSYEELLRENKLLHEYLHDYQEELSKYESYLDRLDKCTEKDPYYENIDLKRKLANYNSSISSLWKSIDWIVDGIDVEKRKPTYFISKLLWFILPSRIYYFLLILFKKNNKISHYQDKFGIAKTVRLIEPMPLFGSMLAQVWTELARYNKGRNKTAALEYAIRAWQAEPRPYRLKFLAFNMHRNGASEMALALLEALPSGVHFSDSEIRLLQKIRSQCVIEKEGVE